MTARITISLAPGGELQLHVNEEGRDLLVKELAALSRHSEHFHLGAFEGAEVEMRSVPYAPGDQIIWAAKVMLRPDEWDAKHYPHVVCTPSGGN